MKRPPLARNAWIAIVGAAIAAAGSATPALAQRTTYGEDPVPQAVERFERFRPYGFDPVPPTHYDDHGYVRAYGMDPVPAQPLNDNLKLEFRSTLPDSVLPIQDVEVLTGAEDGR